MMKTKITYKKVSTMLVGITMLVACSAEDPTPATVKGSPIRFTASVVDATEGTTRAYADAYNASFPDNTDIDVFLYGYHSSSTTTTIYDLSKLQSTSGSSHKWIYTTSGEVDEASGRSLLTQTSPAASEGQAADAVLPSFPNELNKDEDYVDVFAAFFPQGCSVSPTYDSILPSTGSFTFSVQTDQTTEANVKASDFLSNDVTATFKTNSSAINLEMKHRMAKVLVVFNPTEDLTSNNMPGSSDTYSVQNVKKELTVGLNPTSNTTGEISTTGSTTTITAKVGEPFFLPPQTIAKDTQLLQFSLHDTTGTGTGIQNVTYSTSSDLTLREGVYYILTLNIGIRYITLTTTIHDWTDETVNFDKIIL